MYNYTARTVFNSSLEKDRIFHFDYNLLVNVNIPIIDADIKNIEIDGDKMIMTLHVSVKNENDIHLFNTIEILHDNIVVYRTEISLETVNFGKTVIIEIPIKLNCFLKGL